MSTLKVVAEHVRDCADGRLPVSECVAAWHFGVILGLLILAIMCLAFLVSHRNLQASVSPSSNKSSSR
jgi:hypothetical protein